MLRAAEKYLDEKNAEFSYDDDNEVADLMEPDSVRLLDATDD